MKRNFELVRTILKGANIVKVDDVDKEDRGEFAYHLEIMRQANLISPNNNDITWGGQEALTLIGPDDVWEAIKKHIHNRGAKLENVTWSVLLELASRAGRLQKSNKSIESQKALDTKIEKLAEVGQFDKIKELLVQQAIEGMMNLDYS